MPCPGTVISPVLTHTYSVSGTVPGKDISQIRNFPFDSIAHDSKALTGKHTVYSIPTCNPFSFQFFKTVFSRNGTRGRGNPNRRFEFFLNGVKLASQTKRKPCILLEKRYGAICSLDTQFTDPAAFKR